MIANNKSKSSKSGRNYRYAKEPSNQNNFLKTLCALGATILFGAVFFKLAATLHPVSVTNSIAYMSSVNISKAMQPAVSERLADKSFTIVVDGKESTFRLGDYDFTCSTSSDGESQKVEYTDENGKKNVKTITTKGNLSFNETAVNSFIYNLAKEYGTPMIEPRYEIHGDVLTVYKGTDGMGIDFNYLINAIDERIRSGDYTTPIAAQVKVLKAPDVDIDDIYKKVKCEAKDAYVTEDSAGNVSFSADIIGKDFDLVAARQTVAQDAQSWKIKLALTYPKVSLKQVRAPYCLDELSTCTTSYSGSNKARSNNVEKAAENINTHGSFTDGYILQPGEEFSFNEVVGQRTEANGFQKAPVYLSSGSTDDYGGGICQVSTTLYCAALYANLEITERHNHLYVIHYWPTEGCDATVDWGNLDFKFKNNKEYPIKITCSYAKKKLTVKITGTEDGITVKMSSKVTNKVAYQTIYKKPSSENPEGRITGGDRGKTIKVWRSVYKDGKFVSKEVESNNLYNPLNKVIYTKKLPKGEKYS